MKKKFLILIVAIIATFVFTFTGCSTGTAQNGGAGTAGDENSEQNTPTEPITPTESEEPTTPTESEEPEDTTNILIAYFSATGNTENIATYISEVTLGTLYEIVPAVPYTDEDLNYNVSDCRANLEQNDSSARPAISGSVENISTYDIIYVGYPIWWGKLPKIIYTFFDTYDFSGKTIVPFCTSGGSGIATSVNEIKALEPNATVLSGQRFSSGASKSSVESWVNGLNLLSLS